MGASAWPAVDLENVPACPACGATTRESWRTGLVDDVFACAPGRWDLSRCTACGTCWLDPRPTEASILRAYTQYYTHEDAAADGAGSRGVKRALQRDYLRARWGYREGPAIPFGRVLLSRRRRAALDLSVRHLARPEGRARLLDVGCGNGAFLAAMRERGWNTYGLEPDPAAAAAAARAGVEVEVGTLGDAPWEAGTFDAITLTSVIEHVHDPSAALGACHRLLRPGGRIHLVTPNTGSLGAARFGGSWRGLEAPRHLVLFDRAALAGLLKRSGFAEIVFFPHFMGEWFWLASGAIEKGLSPDEAGSMAEAEREPLRREGRAADREVRLFPERAEELVVQARTNGVPA